MRHGHQLFLVTVGQNRRGRCEAGASPPSHSLISDYFPVSTRATALSIYSLGFPLGRIGTTIGGWGAQFRLAHDFFPGGYSRPAGRSIGGSHPARTAKGMSDLEEQPKVDLTPEPVEEVQTEAVDTPSDAPSWQEVFAYLWAKRSFRHLSIAAGLHAFVSYGATNWNPSFLNRIHDMSYTRQATGWDYLLHRCYWHLLGGFLGDQLSDRTGEKRWYFWIPAASLIAMVPLLGRIWTTTP